MQSLVSTICIDHVPKETLDSIFQSAYAKRNEHPKDLIFLSEHSLGSATSFQCRNIEEAAQAIVGLAPISGSEIHRRVFFIADSQTTQDQTLLLVEAWPDSKLETLRVAGEEANVVAVCVGVGTTDIGELQSLADDDGVYRGGPNRHKPVRRGERAPRKQLTRVDG